MFLLTYHVSYVHFFCAIIETYTVLDPEMVARILKTRFNARQYHDEKVAVAEQAYATVDSVVKKLDQDLATFEAYVQSVKKTICYYVIRVTYGDREFWFFHSSFLIAVSWTFMRTHSLLKVSNPIAANDQLGEFQKLNLNLPWVSVYSLKATGEFEAAGGKPNDLAAIQVTSSSNEWILAKIISFDSEAGMYNLSDEDVESNKVFYLPESQVIVLEGVERLSRGDVIYAVYPDTTSFYQATVVQPPRKTQGGSPFVTVNFIDDSDEHGVTHEKAVLLKHIMRPPIGVVIS